jgi:tetratricopeptide (TPR) repeat protein
VPATPYVERALSIIERARGQEHLEVAEVLYQLGKLYLLQGATTQAGAAYLRAKPILLRELGPRDPRYGLLLMQLGELQLLTGQTEAARESVDQAMTAFGDVIRRADHPWTEANRQLGMLLLGLGEYRQAERELRYALVVRSEALSIGQRDKALLYMAPVQNSFGEFYVTVGLDGKAEPLLRDALKAYEHEYGNDHPLLEDILVNLAALYQGKADLSRAREYVDRAKAIHRKSVGYSLLPGLPERTIARAIPKPRPLDGPYTNARAGDEVTYEDGHGALRLRRRIIEVTPVIALIQSNEWDAQKQQWGQGQEEIQPLSATGTEDLLYEFLGVAPAGGDWGADTVTVGGRQIPCRTFDMRGDFKVKYWLAPDVVPAGGIVLVIVDEVIELRLRTFHTGV